MSWKFEQNWHSGSPGLSGNIPSLWVQLDTAVAILEVPCLGVPVEMEK